MKRIFLLLIISISILTSCLPPEMVDYNYNYTIIIYKHKEETTDIFGRTIPSCISNDTLYGHFCHGVLRDDIDLFNKTFTSDTFYYSKEYILEIDSHNYFYGYEPDDYISISLEDSMLVNHLSDVIYNNYSLSFESRRIPLGVYYYKHHKAMIDCFDTYWNWVIDSIAICYYRNE